MALNLRGLQSFRAGLPDAIDAGAKQAADYVGDLAQQLAPEKTGALKASKDVQPGGKPGSYVVSFGVPYAAFVEYGTYASPAQPYLTPALKAINVKVEIKKAIQALARNSRS